MGEVFLRPQTDVDTWYARSAAFPEHGAGLFDLVAESQGEFGVAVTPTLELGTSFVLAGNVLRPYVQAGLSFSQFDGGLDAHLRGAGEDQIMTGHGSGDEVFGRLSAGVNVYGQDQNEIKLRYDGLAGDNTRSTREASNSAGHTKRHFCWIS